MIGKRATLLFTAATAIALAAIPTTAAGAETVPTLLYSQSFETGMDSWTPASDHHERAFRISRTTAIAYHGVTSLSYYLDGRNDDGTIWIQRPFKGLPPNTVVSVETRFQLHSSTKSAFNNWPVVVYAGAAPPSSESDFAIVGLTDQAAGWRQYSGRIVTTTDPAGNLWVAIGIGATWEGTRTYNIDFLNVSA
jgi:hypothetical protein